jgi:hypothetical protein
MVERDDMSSCRSCGAPIVWVVTEARLATDGKPAKPARKMPLDADPDNPAKALKCVDGNLLFTRERDGNGDWIVRYVKKGPNLYRSHFASCPQRTQHRKSR